MKTKVAEVWFNQEISALGWQIKEEPKLIKLTEQRIKHVKNGGIDCAKCDLNYLETLLIKVNEEKGSAQKRKDVFLMTYEPSNEIKPDKKGAELFIKNNAHKVKAAKVGEQFGYYEFLSTVAQLFGLPDRRDSIIDWYFRVLDYELDKIAS